MEAEIYWKAVQNNDAKFNGAFFYAVNSTKIYCKPSCCSKLPKRENVQFFSSSETAEARGFRACLRCQPKAETVNRQTEIVLRACELLETEEQITLENLSADLDLSPTYLQKIFKEIIGVSPKKYAEAKRLEKFKSEIRNGNDVTNAIYESGFGSSSRLYEKLDNRNSVRAVATACASNRVALIIPCHRVVRSSGELGGYRWGIERKKAMLDNEKQS